MARDQKKRNRAACFLALKGGQVEFDAICLSLQPCAGPYSSSLKPSNGVQSL